ncbi:TrmB family transcriptional regulator [Virgibacillus oceani]
MSKLQNRDIVSTLKELGFTEYESRIYIALLTNHPSNGNTISTLSGVPGPKVYEALRKMKEQGLVFTVTESVKGKQVHYSPLPYEELLKSKKNKFMNDLSFLNQAFDKISSRVDTNWSELFVIQGYAASIEVVRSAILEGKKEVLISCWKKEFTEVKDYLYQSHEKGIEITTFLFDGKQEGLPWNCFGHYKEKLALDRHTGELSIVIDEQKTILLHSLDESPHSVVSSHPVMVSTTKNYIRHDIYVNRVINDFEKEMKGYYGNNLEGLIDDF